MFKLLASAVAAAIMFAPVAIPVANADGNTDEYMQFLSSHGIYNDTAPNGVTWLANGQQTCVALRNGASEKQLIGQFEGQMGRAQSDDIVVAAHRYLCPDA